MKAVLFDIQSGVSGDMVLASLLDCGVDVEQVERQLSLMDIPKIDIRLKRIDRNAISALSITVCEDNSKEFRMPADYTSIAGLIERSRLSGRVKNASLKIYEVLARAESKVHQIPLEKVHFHELSSCKTLVNIVGTAACIEILGMEAMFSTPVIAGYGNLIKTSHGILPLPAPAVLEALRGRTVLFSEVHEELTTPSGAAIIAAMCTHHMPKALEMNVECVGYGTGHKTIEGYPNFIRAVVGTVENADFRMMEATSYEPANA
jgi:uncharacterized protein (TIGR00299 family) protein